MGLVALLVGAAVGVLAIGAVLPADVAMGLGSGISRSLSLVGVLVIVLMYLLREQRIPALALSWLLLILGEKMELYALPGFLALLLYNGRRGRQPRYFFYWFYPSHLLLFWLLGNFVLSGKRIF